MHKHCIHPIERVAKVPIKIPFVEIYNKKIILSKPIIAPPVDANIHHLNPVKNPSSATH
jgi:hypothetical protein